MPRWRKATWALLIWNVLMAVWVIGGMGAVSDNCAGETGQALELCESATVVGAGIGVTFILVIWFIGFIVLGLIWLMSRPKENVVVYGPEGQQVTVSEKEAKRRVGKGWSYHHPGNQPPVAG